MGDTSSELSKLKELFEMNFINEEEYKRRCAELRGTADPLESSFGKLDISPTQKIDSEESTQQANSSAPFVFGGSAAQNNRVDVSGMTFGSSQSNSGFSFSSFTPFSFGGTPSSVGSDSSTPSFSFGSASTPSFSFGSASTPSVPSNSPFGSNTTPFTFGSAATTGPFTSHTPTGPFSSVLSSGTQYPFPSSSKPEAKPETKPENPITTFKVVILGDGGVGKTELRKTYMGLAFDTRYIPTIGVEVHPATFVTNVRDLTVRFNFWDCAGQEKFGGLRDGYYIGGQAAMIVYDTTSRLTYKNLATWARDFDRVVENAPVVYVCNKTDLDTENTIKTKEIARQDKSPFVEVSAKNLVNIMEPLNVLARQLLKNESLQLFKTFGGGNMGPADITFNVSLWGSSGVGKSTFLHRHSTGEFQRAYQADSITNVAPLLFYTTRGAVLLKVFDVPGKSIEDENDNHWRCIPQLSDGMLLMFDTTNRLSYKNVPNFYREMTRDTGTQPIVLFGNKVDVRERTVKPQAITFHRKKNLQYYDVSAKSNYNFEKPFLFLIRKLLGDPNLHFVMTPVITPPEIQLDAEKIAQYERELMAAAEATLPDDDDDL